MRNLSFTFIIVLLVTGLFYFISFLRTENGNARSDWDTYLAEQFLKVGNGPAEKADQPDMAAMQNYYMTIDPAEKRVPAERLLQAFQYSRSEQANRDYKSSSVDNEWTQISSNMGGRTRAIAWDPNDATGKKAWAGGVTGGLWFNNDVAGFASEWEIVDDFWPSLSVSCIAFDPNDPEVMYVGTGEYQTARFIYRESSGVGIGIWKSSDAGITWELIPSTEDFKYISDIVIKDENGTSALYAGVVSGFYHGVNHQSGPTDGLYRSVDGGETWEQVFPDIDGEDVPYAPADLTIGPGGRIFAGTMKNLDGKGGATILYSDDGTTGSWMVFDDYESNIQGDPNYPVPGRVIIACAPSDQNIVYALIGAGWYDNMGGNRAEGRYILRSDDGGESWTEKSLPGGDPSWASLSWHAFVAAVNPTNPDDVFVGGLDVWKTMNGGNSWTHLSDWALMYYGGGDDYVHADQHIQVYKPGSSTEMLFGSDGGVFYSSSANTGNPVFQEKNDGYSTLQFYTCDIYPVEGMNYFVGGLQDNGTLLYMGQPLDINDMIDGADGAYCFFDENEPQIMITSYYYNAYTLFLNWNDYTGMGNYGTGVFINPADYDSENNILFANGVTFTSQNANKLLRISNIPNNPYDQLININTGLNTYFSNIKVSPYAPEGSSTVFAGSQNGRLFKVYNADATPNTVEIGDNDFPVAYMSCIALGGSEDTLLVTFSNYGVPSVWQTFDDANTWTDISGNLPDMPVRWAMYHPQSARQVMLATELGVWTTNDAGADEVIWTQDAGMPNVRVDMLQMRESDNTVLAATHGRGLMYCTWDYNPPVFIPEKRPLEISIYPNPASNYLRFNNTEEKNLKLELLTLDGRLVLEKILLEEEEADISHLSEGTYVARLISEHGSRSEKLIIQR